MLLVPCSYWSNWICTDTLNRIKIICKLGKKGSSVKLQNLDFRLPRIVECKKMHDQDERLNNKVFFLFLLVNNVYLREKIFFFCEEKCFIVAKTFSFCCCCCGCCYCCCCWCSLSWISSNDWSFWSKNKSYCIQQQQQQPNSSKYSGREQQQH